MSDMDAAERQVGSDARGAGRLEQPRRQQAASFRHPGVVEFVFDALLAAAASHLAMRTPPAL